VRLVRTAELTLVERLRLRELLWAAFGGDAEDGMTEEDWAHALGGVHVIASTGPRIVAHAAVVERLLYVGGRPLRTGYVEGVAVEPDRQRRGFGTQVMEAAARLIVAGFELGALGTGEHAFYRRLGWETWRGPSFVRLPDGTERPTPADDGFILVLRTPATPPLDLEAPIVCQWRPGDPW